MRPEPAEILSHFALDEGEAAATRVRPLGNGHINETYLATMRGGRRYVLQRINPAIFPDADALMENIARVTGHLRDSSCSTLGYITTLDGARFYPDAGGAAWRLVPFIENTAPASNPPTVAQARAAAGAFAEFARRLSDLPGPRLHETIPGFHDSQRRFRDLVAATEADPCNRGAGARHEIDALLAREPWCRVIADAMADGSVPERVAHNDAKLDNILFDAATGAAACVIDLDTVMPGSVLHDFGDLVRSAAATAPEDAAGDVGISDPIYRALEDGYQAGLGDMLTPRERDLLPFAGKLITYEQAMRFLTDHLLGDPYYKTSPPGRNLQRARNQLRLVEALESKSP